MQVHVNYFSKLQDDLPVEYLDESNQYDMCSELMKSDTFSLVDSCRSSHFRMLYDNGFEKKQLCNFSEAGSNYLGKRCGVPSTDMSKYGEESTDNDNEFDWTCKRLKLDPSCIGNVKTEIKFLNGRVKMLQDCLNVKRGHENYCYKKVGDLNLKKHNIEDNS